MSEDRQVTYSAALNQAMHEEMARDESVFIIGEDIALWGDGQGVFGVTAGLQEAFGPQRMMWGSDYPLVNQREGYQRALNLTMDELKSRSDEDRAWIFGKTAMKVFPIRA